MKSTFLSVFFFIQLSLISSLQSAAQCPQPGEMIATTLTSSGGCFLFVQHAIPNSNVTIYNENGLVAQGVASSAGTVIISYSCSSNPITEVVSIHISSGAFCISSSISAPVILPVKITSFTSQITSRGVLLKWKTSYELNNEKYIIEKSTNGTSWTDIGEVPGSKELSMIELSYTFEDDSFLPGSIAWYRLRQVDIDNTTSYSKTVYVNDSRNNQGSIRVFPNPFERDIQLSGIRASDLKAAAIRLYNMSGQNISFKISGSNSLEVDPAAPAGIYFLQINGNAHKLLKK